MSVIREIPWDQETILSVFSRWSWEPHAFLLESVEGGERWGRYSFIGLQPTLIFRGTGNNLEIQRGNRRERKTGEPLEELRRLLDENADPSLPRFAGGLVGYVAYDAVRNFEKLPSREAERALPEFYFFRPSVLLIFDNLRQSLCVVADQKQQLDATLRKLAGRGSTRELSRGGKSRLRWNGSLSRAEYEARVRRIKQYVVQGDVTQAVLSIQFVAASRRDPYEAYRLLRRLNPSPYLYYLRMGDHQVVGASPETMIRLEGGQMTLRPIAGTRPRGSSEAEDRRLEAALLQDPKERAEHIMLVDLGRNDLGRVAEAGSVQVNQLMSIERYSHVMHLVSNVEGRLQSGKDAFDLLRAVFPAGTLTGSPKIRAMEIIEELEPVRRGLYGGSVGYFSCNGNMDMAITIRSALFHRGKVFVQAGAGIVADSDPTREYEECLNKAKAMMMAVEG